MAAALSLALLAVACDGGAGTDATADRPSTEPRKVDVRATAEGALPVLVRGQPSTPEGADDLLQACIRLRRAADQADPAMRPGLTAAADTCATEPHTAAQHVKAALAATG